MAAEVVKDRAAVNAGTVIPTPAPMEDLVKDRAAAGVAERTGREHDDPTY